MGWSLVRLPPDLTPDDVALGSPHAAYDGDVAWCRYLYGHGTPASCESAVLYYEIAANAAIEEMYRLKVGDRPKKTDTVG